MALVASVKWPVDSTTICAPTSSPVELGGVALGEDLDLLAVDGDEVFAGGDFVLQVAENRVVLEQVGQRCRAGQVVDGDKINLGIAERGAKNVAANAAEAVDANLNCHVRILLRQSMSLWLSLSESIGSAAALRVCARKAIPPNP